MAVGMTSAQIWAKLKSDPNFAINFIIDNNPAAVESNLTGQGVSLPANPSNAQIRAEIDAMMMQIKEGVDNTDLIANDILYVPYIDTNPNYTGGMINNPDFMQAVDNARTSKDVILLVIKLLTASPGTRLASSDHIRFFKIYHKDLF